MPARIWFAMDALFTRDPLIEKLGMEHGAAGPLAIAHLLGVAKLHDDNGRFGIYWDALASAIYVKQSARARAIVAQAEGLMVLTVERRDAKGFDGCFPTWMQWQWDDKRRGNSERQQKKRDRDKDVTDNPAPVTQTSRNSHAPKRDESVTTGTETGTGTTTTTPSSSVARDAA